MAVVMNADELNAFMREVFHQVADDFHVDQVGEGEVTIRLLTAERHLRGLGFGGEALGQRRVNIVIKIAGGKNRRCIDTQCNCLIQDVLDQMAGDADNHMVRWLRQRRQIRVTG